MSYHVFPKKLHRWRNMVSHSLSRGKVCWVLSVSLPFSTPTMQTKLKTAMETKRNKGKNLNGIQMIFHLNSLTWNSDF